jgi:hypothetical protein
MRRSPMHKRAQHRSGEPADQDSPRERTPPRTTQPQHQATTLSWSRASASPRIDERGDSSSLGCRRRSRGIGSRVGTPDRSGSRALRGSISGSVGMPVSERGGPATASARFPRCSNSRRCGRGCCDGWALLPLRVRGLERVRIHAGLTILAKFGSRAREGARRSAWRPGAGQSSASHVGPRDPRYEYLRDSHD